MGGFKQYLNKVALKKMESNKKKYYTVIDDCVKYTLYVLDRIEDSGHYLEYVASVRAVLAKDYADTFPYSELSADEILEYIQNLELLKGEALGFLSEAKKAASYKVDEEIGKASMEIFGIDSIDELGDALIQQHEKDQNEADAKKQVFAAAYSALNGKSGSLKDVFLQGDSKKTNSGDDDN